MALKKNTPAGKAPAKATPAVTVGKAPVAAPSRAVTAPASTSTAVRNTPIPRAAAPIPKKEITFEMIARRAYEISVSGNGGSQEDNWFSAERELRSLSRPPQTIGVAEDVPDLAREFERSTPAFCCAYNGAMGSSYEDPEDSDHLPEQSANASESESDHASPEIPNLPKSQILDFKCPEVLLPLFPLPNIVLFPRSVLPLHIFEERYKAMTRRSLKGDRQIAMALLRPGWEKSYHARPAIDPVVCVGSILTHEHRSDGTYNCLLQGLKRAKVISETGGEPYRRGLLRPLIEIPATPSASAMLRDRLVELFTTPANPLSAMGLQFRRLLSTSLPIADIADLAAFTFLDDVALKQSFLVELDVTRRVERLIESLEQMRPDAAAMTPEVGWRYKNPGLN